MKRDEIALLTTLSGDSLVTRAEAARLKNENLRLSQQLEERAAQLRNATTPVEKRRSGARAEKSPHRRSNAKARHAPEIKRERDAGNGSPRPPPPR